MILNVKFQVEIPNEQLEKVIANVGYTKLVSHAYDYLRKTTYAAFHKDGQQEVKNLRMTIEKL